MNSSKGDGEEQSSVANVENSETGGVAINQETRGESSSDSESESSLNTEDEKKNQGYSSAESGTSITEHSDNSDDIDYVPQTQPRQKKVAAKGAARSSAKSKDRGRGGGTGRKRR